MPPKYQLNLPPVKVTTLDHAESIDCDSHVQPVDLSVFLREAVESSGCQHKEAAIATGYQPDYWNRALNGERGIHLNRLSRLPERVQRNFVTRWALLLRLRVSDGDTQKHAAVTLLKAAADFLAESA